MTWILVAGCFGFAIGMIAGLGWGFAAGLRVAAKEIPDNRIFFPTKGDN